MPVSAHVLVCPAFPYRYLHAVEKPTCCKLYKCHVARNRVCLNSTDSFALRTLLMRSEQISQCENSLKFFWNSQNKIFIVLRTFMLMEFTFLNKVSALWHSNCDKVQIQDLYLCTEVTKHSDN